MAIETKQTLVAKELSDAMVLLVEVVKQARAGKPLADIVSGSLPLMIAAIAGIDSVDDELGANFEVALATIGSHAGELVAALLKKPVVQTV